MWKVRLKIDELDRAEGDYRGREKEEKGRVKRMKEKRIKKRKKKIRITKEKRGNGVVQKE